MRPSTARTGFTLIELLVVVAIIALLVGIVLAVGAAVNAASDRSRTESTIKILDGVLSEWEATSNREVTWGFDGQPNAQRSVYDVQADTLHVYLISDLLGGPRNPPTTPPRGLSKTSIVKDMLAQIEEDRLYLYKGTAPEWVRVMSRYEPDPSVNDATNPPPPPPPPPTDWLMQYPAWQDQYTILDAWDRPIRFVHPGREWVAGPPFNDQANGIERDDDGTVRTGFEMAYGVAANGKPYFVSGGPDRDFGDLQLEIAVNSRNPDAIAAAADNIFSYEVIKQ